MTAPAAAPGVNVDLPAPSGRFDAEDHVAWVWDVGRAHVHAKYDKATGAYICGLATSEFMFELGADEARDIGAALLAAYLYQFVWEQETAK